MCYWRGRTKREGGGKGGEQGRYNERISANELHCPQWTMLQVVRKDVLSEERKGGLSCSCAGYLSCESRGQNIPSFAFRERAEARARGEGGEGRGE